MAIKTLGAVMEAATDGHYKADVSKEIGASKETETTVKTLAVDDLEQVSGGKTTRIRNRALGIEMAGIGF
jgi:hypothetical protein